MNILSRPYDLVIPTESLKDIMDRRRSPDGVEHKIKEHRIAGNTKKYEYPFLTMELGDFFVAPIADRSEKSMRINFHQNAARQDYEIAIVRTRTRDNKLALRVTVVIIGLVRYKIALDRLLDADSKLPVDEQKYAKVPRPRYSDAKSRAKAKRKRDASQHVKRKAKAKLPPKYRDGPYWEGDLPEPPKVQVFEPEVPLTDEQMIARAMEALK